jgi:hypothetical protein
MLFKSIRRQFPTCLNFSMTINKSLGTDFWQYLLTPCSLKSLITGPIKCCIWDEWDHYLINNHQELRECYATYSHLNILWHIYLLLGNNRKTNETMVIARQRPVSNNGTTLGSSLFYVVHSWAISCNRTSSVSVCSVLEWSTLVGEWVSLLEDCCCSFLVSCSCQKLVAEAWG